MFAERLKLILNATGAKVPDLAHIIGCDRSNLDRILKGVRIPRKQGRASGGSYRHYIYMLTKR